MYGLDGNVELGHFVGKRLQQISVGSFDLILTFEGDVSVSIVGSVEYEEAGHTKRWSVDSPRDAGQLLALLGTHVSAARNLGGGTLALSFQGGAILRILETSDNYESYNFTSDNGLLLIV
ncbi:MAG: hypothetical protein HN849_11520 [Victivallales bacterium]|jgi:hypothetical protein|nr:hypothetical protein [Victivallales bacterium]